MLAIIGGRPEHFVPFINLYKETAVKTGKNLSQLQIGVNNHFYVSENSQQAADEFYPHYAEVMSRIGRERGWPPLSQQQYEYLHSPMGALMVGSVQEVIDKILYEHELFGNTRFLAQASVGNVPHKLIMHSIELFGTKVVPVIRKEVKA